MFDPFKKPQTKHSINMSRKCKKKQDSGGVLVLKLNIRNIELRNIKLARISMMKKDKIINQPLKFFDILSRGSDSSLVMRASNSLWSRF